MLKLFLPCQKYICSKNFRVVFVGKRADRQKNKQRERHKNTGDYTYTTSLAKVILKKLENVAIVM